MQLKFLKILSLLSKAGMEMGEEEANITNLAGSLEAML